ncbi:MAG: hypothetical protein GY778_29615 [bacterium]|nr:hypothetical protein [bacterium]
MGRCLGVGPERAAEIERHDPNFADDLARLRNELNQRRQALVDAFQSPDAADDHIRQCVERIIETHSALERRVTEYLLIMRHELTGPEQARLFEVLADGVRRGQSRGWRGGRGQEGGAASPRGQGRGNRWGQHQGGGRGRGKGRGGNGSGRGAGRGQGKRSGGDHKSESGAPGDSPDVPDETANGTSE